MKSVSGKELCQALERHGRQLLRINGSHHIYGRVGSVVRLSVPVRTNRSLKRGLLSHLLKNADLREDDI